MTDQYEMFNRETLKDTNDATSLPGLDCGTMHLTSRDGRMVTGFGQAVAHASLLVYQVDKKVRQTIDTYGQNGSGSSKSVALQQSLENRLQAQFQRDGSTLYNMSWKRKATPLGRLYCQLAVSAHPTSGRDYGLWPTVTKDSANNRTGKYAQGGTPLTAMALWATPAVRDHKDTGDLEKSRWRKDGKERNDTLGRQVFGSTALTESKGSLNPEFPCWLMGIPNEWVSSIVQGMQSYRKSPRNSSGQQGKT